MDPVQVLSSEPRDEGCVLECLHLDGIGRFVPFQLDDDQVSVAVQREHVEAVSLGPPCVTRPATELEGDYLDGGAQDLRMRDHPFLKMLPFPQAGLS